MSEEKTQNIDNQEISFSFANGKVTIPNEVEDVQFIDLSNKDYIPFGSDNLFPQAYEKHLRHSSTTRAVIRSKTVYTMGSGFNEAISDDPSGIVHGFSVTAEIPLNR